MCPFTFPFGVSINFSFAQPPKLTRKKANSSTTPKPVLLAPSLSSSPSPRSLYTHCSLHGNIRLSFPQFKIILQPKSLHLKCLSNSTLARRSTFDISVSPSSPHRPALHFTAVHRPCQDLRITLGLFRKIANHRRLAYYTYQLKLNTSLAFWIS